MRACVRACVRARDPSDRHGHGSCRHPGGGTLHEQAVSQGAASAPACEQSCCWWLAMSHIGAAAKHHQTHANHGEAREENDVPNMRLSYGRVRIGWIERLPVSGAGPANQARHCATYRILACALHAVYRLSLREPGNRPGGCPTLRRAAWYTVHQKTKQTIIGSDALCSRA